MFLLINIDFKSRIGTLRAKRTLRAKLGGDQATKDPRRLVFAIFKKFGKEKYFVGDEAVILSKMMGKAPLSSSMGRVLDALSCYFDICTKRTYDGEPAMKLEKYLANGKDKYPFDIEEKKEAIGEKMKGKEKVVEIDTQIKEKIGFASILYDRL